MGACKKTWFRFNRKYEYEEDKSATSSGVSSSESGFKTPTVDIVNQDPAGDKTRLTTTTPEKKSLYLRVLRTALSLYSTALSLYSIMCWHVWRAIINIMRNITAFSL